jgi:hypothetical protein
VLFSNKHSSNVEFYLVLASIVVIEEVEWSSVRDIKDSSEYDFSFSIEMNPVYWWV